MSAANSEMHVLQDREAMLALAPQLEALASRCGQPGAMHWMAYFLDHGVTRFRTPLLVLALRPGAASKRALQLNDIDGAALYFEYRLFNVSTGIVATADAVGFNSIVAPRGERNRIVAAATRELVRRGAVIVLSTYENAGESGMQGPLANWSGVRWAWRERQLARVLPLQDSFDETLAKLGKSTRFNLRYYRRRLMKEVGCDYVPDAVPLLRGADLHAINANSLNPVPVEEFERRVRCASELSDSYLCGLRGSDGRWLSLIGGWRQDGTTILFWQTNMRGLEKYSLGTVMRSFYLEDEIAHGAKRLLIFGGTSHTMSHGFLEDPVADLIVQRQGPRAMALRALVRFMSSPRNKFGRASYLDDVLRSSDRDWLQGTASTLAGQSEMIESPPSRNIA